MNNFSFYIFVALVSGWCLKCIWEDLKRRFLPPQAAMLNGAATVTLNPSATSSGFSAMDVAGVLNAAILALNVMSNWLEQVQIENPRLPEECLTAQQWLRAALDKVGEITGVDLNSSEEDN